MKMMKNHFYSFTEHSQMSLFIGYVDKFVSVAELTGLFEDTFGADVKVRFSKERKNRFGIWYKSATIEVKSNTSSLTHFISQISLHGNNTIIGNGKSYTIQFAEEEIPVRKFIPRVM
jgi:hypothetical protein